MDSGNAGDCLDVYVLGVTSFCSVMPFFPSFVLRYGDEQLVVDPTSGLVSAMSFCSKVSGGGLRIEDVDSCFVSHAHTDHAGGTVDFALNKFYKEAKRGEKRPRFIGPKDVIDACWEYVLRGTLENTFGSTVPDYREISLRFDEIFERVELDTDGSFADVGAGLEVAVKKGVHAVPGGSYASKFRWKGLTLGYSGDTAPSMDGDDVLPFLLDSDMVVYEVGGSNPIEGHTPLHMLKPRMQECIEDDEIARKVFLIHYSDSFFRYPSQVEPFNLLLPFHHYTVSSDGVQKREPDKAGKRLFGSLTSY